MALVLIFLLGIGNFALHRAVLESRHPMLSENRWYIHRLGGRVTLATEFLLLFAGLLLASEGWPWVAWIYLGYTALNAVAAWLIVTRRV